MTDTAGATSNSDILGAQPDSLSLSIDRILGLLPHRYPFALVDRIIEYVPGQRAVGLKNVTINEPQFQGHFPEQGQGLGQDHPPDLPPRREGLQGTERQEGGPGA